MRVDRKVDRKNERGATLVTTAFFATAVVVFVGLVADAGLMMYQRTRMQTAADAAALAGAKALLNGQAQAVAAAQELAKRNGFPIAANQVTVQKGSRVTVNINSPTDSLVGRILAASQAQAGPPSGAQPASFVIGSLAAADLHCVEVQNGPRPWGVPETDFVPGWEYIIKNGGGGGVCGEYLALGIDGTGANIYRESILNGAKTTVRVGDLVSTEPGNMSGPTVTAVNQLIGNDRTSYEEAKRDPSRTPRVVTLILMTQESYFNARGRSGIVVSGFGRFFITYTTSRGEVYGRFLDRVKATQVAGTGVNYAVKLVDAETPI
jgi:hypothetical protein